QRIRGGGDPATAVGDLAAGAGEDVGEVPAQLVPRAEAALLVEQVEHGHVQAAGDAARARVPVGLRGREVLGRERVDQARAAVIDHGEHLVGVGDELGV